MTPTLALRCPLLHLSTLRLLSTLGRAAVLIVALLASAPAAASLGKCQPCGGITVDDPVAAAAALASAPRLEPEHVLYLRWSAELASSDPAATSRTLGEVTGAGAIPWLVLRLATPPPLLANVEALEGELERLAALARATPPGTYFELVWEATSEIAATEDAFLVKRAAVAISGAQPDAQVLLRLRSLDTGFLRTLYGEEVAAYLDGILVHPAAPIEELTEALASLDPGSDIAVAGLSGGNGGDEILPGAARAAERGATVAIFEGGDSVEDSIRPLLLLAREFSGDVSFDPFSSAAGAETWSFVHGEDLSLRVIVERPADSSSLSLDFTSAQLTSPKLIDPTSGEASPLFGGRRTRRGYSLDIDDPPPSFVLKIERAGVASLEGVEGVEEEVLVEDVRGIPVEEILRRLQATEDAQLRRLRNYIALNTTSLRFSLGGTAQSLDATYRGAFFFQRDQPSDWAWEEFLINGVRWRSKRIPQIPLIQPEKASALPLEITFTRDYRYRLRTTATVAGRDCWVVDFEPVLRPEPGRSLFQGTVWIDRELYVRVRTRAVQLGLEGEVLSNEETITYSPLEEDGAPAEWSLDAYYLPLQLVGQQILSLLDSTTVLEREVVLSEVEINAGNFEERRQAKLDSPITMLRDTERGLRYLVNDEESGDRVVQEKLDPSRLFLGGGVFYDESQDFPIPLAGVNYFNYDWRGSGTQINAFLAGPLLTVDAASPSLFGSRFTGGVDLFALAFAGTDSVFRGGSEAPEEDVEILRPNVDFAVGRPLGSFFKLDFEYSLGWIRFDEADDTGDDFTIPSDHLQHSFTLTPRYNRRGYRLRLFGRHVVRSEWERWGLPGNREFEADHDSFSQWGAAVAKVWHLPKFQKVGAQIEYAAGDNLDRFSKYQFGFFSDVRVHGYRSDRIRAEEAWAAHLSYGFELGQLFRLDLVADTAWASDELSGLDREYLAGVGLIGTVTGPWNTLFNVDVGVPVAGPDTGFSALIAVLKLFR